MKKRKGGVVYDTETAKHLGSTLGMLAWLTPDGHYFVVCKGCDGRDSLILSADDRGGRDIFFDKLLSACGVERL